MKVERILLALLIAGVAAFPAAAYSSPRPHTPTQVTIDLIAKNYVFDMSTITVPAGAKVTINFENEDVGIPHNFSLYDSSSANNALFKGEVINGVNKITYTFTAPAKAGTYVFRSDLLPETMSGSFVVQ